MRYETQLEIIRLFANPNFPMSVYDPVTYAAAIAAQTHLKEMIAAYLASMTNDERCDEQSRGAICDAAGTESLTESPQVMRLLSYMATSNANASGFYIESGSKNLMGTLKWKKDDPGMFVCVTPQGSMHT